jgi:hypothetical protein
MGVEGPVLFFDFAGFPKSYSTRLDELRFKRIYSGDNDNCKSEPERKIPETRDVVRWLDTNKSPSLQSYVALAASFENAGGDATDIKVAKAKVEFQRESQQTGVALQDAWNSRSSWRQFVDDHGLDFFNDYSRLGSTWILGKIADFGFRPAKAFLVVLAVVGTAWVVFRLIGVIAFTPEKKSDVRPVGFIFLFDHLIPAYRIRNDNYEIETYYTTPRRAGAASPVTAVSYFGRRIDCAPALAWQVRWTERCLIVIKALGFVLAGFLIAAINALVNSH